MKTTTVETSRLSGAALDWAVAKAVGLSVTELVAFMRAIVSAELGDDVDVPANLVRCVMRKPGWYHVKDENGFWQCAQWNGHGWNGIYAVEAKDGAWLEIGPRIPTHDEKEDWQVVPKEITAEAGYKSALIGEFSEKYSDRCPECEAMGDEEDCIICLGTGEVENRIPVSWENIKAIHKRIVEIADVQSAREEEA